MLPLCPFLEQGSRYDAYVAANYPDAWGNLDWMRGKIVSFACPSDSNAQQPSISQQQTRTNYVGSLGDTIAGFSEMEHTTRGFMSGRMYRNGTTLTLVTQTLASLSDGTSNTIAFSEAVNTSIASSMKVKEGNAYDTSVKTPNNCRALSTDRKEINSGTSVTVYGHGYYGFGDGRAGSATFSTVMPPNSVSCIGNSNSELGNPGWPIYAFFNASSYHSGGVNACLGDASVRFISETVDCNDQSFDISTATTGVQNSPTGAKEISGKSPFGIWGAMGSINGGESTSL